MFYETIKLTCKNRCSIQRGSVVTIEVNEEVCIPEGSIGMFYIRKKHAVQGIQQLVHSPFKEGVYIPTVSVKSDAISSVELLPGEEIGELFIFGNGNVCTP